MFGQLGTFWTWPNVVSLARMVLAVPVAVLILSDASLWATAPLLVVCGATDWLDGWVARQTDTLTEWGRVLDPLADKVAVLIIGLALLLVGRLPLWWVLLIGARDLAIVIGGTLMARGTGEVHASLWLGKAAVTAAGVTLLAAVLRTGGLVMELFLWITAVLMMLSLAQYVRRFYLLHTQHR